MKLLNVGHNAKTVKSDAKGYLTGILYLAPYKTSGKNVCSHATVGCSTACLHYAGFGRYTKVRQARENKTKFFLNFRQEFKEWLIKDIGSLIRKAKKQNRIPLVRLNGTSDLPWEQIFPDIFSMFPEVQFYCYTKIKARMLRFLSGDFPKNYHLTYSRSEHNEQDCLEILRKGGSVAVVFDKIPPRWKRFKVTNGDEDDLRFLNKGVIGLKMKGRAKFDKSGFVVKTMVQM